VEPIEDEIVSRWKNWQQKVKNYVAGTKIRKTVSTIITIAIIFLGLIGWDQVRDSDSETADPTATPAEATVTPEPKVTVTPIPTATPVPTATPEPSPTPTPIPTLVPAPTEMVTDSGTDELPNTGGGSFLPGALILGAGLVLLATSRKFAYKPLHAK
jgi:hypothetical protein